jgi:hypothetical protein
MEQSEAFYVASTSVNGADDVPIGASNPGWTLNQPGPQSYEVEVFYPEEFKHKPNVYAGITGITYADRDVGLSTLKLDIDKNKIKKDSFVAVLSKAGDEKITRVDVAWAAVGD